MNSSRSIWGVGLSTVAANGAVLDAWYADLGTGLLPEDAVPPPGQQDERRGVELKPIVTQVDLDAPPASTADAYLRLHALSHRLIVPNSANLDGLLSHLPTVAWTPAGPMLPEDAARLRVSLRLAGLHIEGLDKFPRLTDYVLPTGVRIADAARVRLGAYLSAGTVVMHEGFVNFNAGTLGASMVEGRISQGVTVGAGSDIGGGASIMGTMSGGGKHRVSIGEGTLLGANAGIGISLGDNCVVEAGLYLTAGTKVLLPRGPQTLTGERPTVKAVELSGAHGMLYRRNSTTGAVEALPREGVGVTLNEELHV